MLNTMSNENFGFEELELWKKVREFKNDVRKISKAFPADEKYRLTDQLINNGRAWKIYLS